MECIEIELNKVCRTCKTEASEMKSLYLRESESGTENPQIDEMLMACASVQVDTEDNLPKLICQSCFVQLKNAYMFKDQCQKTDIFLRDYVQNIKKIKEETELAELEFTTSEVVCETKPLTLTNEDAKKDTIHEITNDPELQSEDGIQKENADYIQTLDNNVAIYKCTSCSKECHTLEDLRCHKKQHTNKVSKCKQNVRSYTRLNHVQRHELSHRKRKLHVCKFCNRTFTRYESFKRHLITHLKDRPFSCPSCNRSFTRVELLEKHVTICKGKRMHICDICNRAFLREDSMQVHKREHENADPVLPTLENLNNIKEHYLKIEVVDEANVFSGEENLVGENIQSEVEISDNDDQVKIDEIRLITNDIYPDDEPPEILLEKVKSEDELLVGEEQTVETDNGNDCESNNSVRSKYNPTKQSPKECPTVEHSSKAEGEELKPLECPEYEVHTVQHDLKLYECQTCKKRFSQLSSVKRHRLTCGEVKPFRCGICNKFFSQRDPLENHMKLHLSTAAFTYDLCQAVFKGKKGLAKHVTCKHNSDEMMVVAEKKFKCQYCPEAFTTVRYRDSHAKMHVGEKKFQCKTCEKTFISKSVLTQHMKFHNDNSKKFLCSECGQKFVRNDFLIIHMRRHRGEKPFECKFCGKGFARSSDLTVHERYHTGEKTHLCVVCGRGFARAYSLTVHMRTHTGEKPYRCTYCNAAFTQGNDLKAHVRRHTGERFQCELCPKTFVVGYLLTQHKRVVHGLNIVSNIRRLQSVKKLDPDDPPPVTVPLPAPIVITNTFMPDPLEINQDDMPELELE